MTDFSEGDSFSSYHFDGNSRYHYHFCLFESNDFYVELVQNPPDKNIIEKVHEIIIHCLNEYSTE